MIIVLHLEHREWFGVVHRLVDVAAARLLSLASGVSEEILRLGVL